MAFWIVQVFEEIKREIDIGIVIVFRALMFCSVQSRLFFDGKTLGFETSVSLMKQPTRDFSAIVID